MCSHLTSGELVPTKSYEGAARLKVKSVEEMQAAADENRKRANESDKAKQH